MMDIVGMRVLHSPYTLEPMVTAYTRIVYCRTRPRKWINVTETIMTSAAR